MFEIGGMKVVGSRPYGPPVAASSRTIMVDGDECYGHLGGDSILRMTLDFEGARTDEIVDVNVTESGNLVESRTGEIRTSTDDGPSQTLTPPTPPMPPAPIPSVQVPHQSQSVYIEDVSDEEMMEIQVLPAPSRQSKGTTGGVVGKKYYLSSELGKMSKLIRLGRRYWIHLCSFRFERFLLFPVKSLAT
jgi:hypothetical protein